MTDAFHSDRHPRPAVHGRFDRLLCHQRHDDEARDRGLPPYEVLVLRGTAATLWGIPLLLALGYGRQIALMFDKRVLLRNLFELVAILAYVVALANMQIADATALGQVTPLLLLLGASILFRERIGGVRMALIGLGFIGALMVAQPTMQGISVYALLALANAVLSRGARPRRARGSRREVPGMIVAISAVVVVLIGAGIAHLVSRLGRCPRRIICCCWPAPACS